MESKVLKVENGVETVSISVATGKGQPRAEVTFTRPTAESFQEYIVGLTGDALKAAYRTFVAALERATRTDAYETIASASTIIRVGKGNKQDLMDYPVKNFLKAYNATVARMEVLASEADIEEEGDESYTITQLFNPSPEHEDMVRAIKRNVGFGPWQATRVRHEKNGAVRWDKDTNTLVAA